MSLVHEALKKVQEERSRRSAPKAHEPAFLAGGGRALPSPSRAILLGGILILIVVIATAWRFGLFPGSGSKPPHAHPSAASSVPPVSSRVLQEPPLPLAGRESDEKAVDAISPHPSPLLRGSPESFGPAGEGAKGASQSRARSPFDEGVERFSRREWDAALERFHAAREAGIQPARSWLYIGKIAGERVDLSRAEEAYRKALSIDPGLWEAANNLGALLGRTGRTEEARLVLEKALAANPNEPSLHLNLAVVLEKEGERTGARRHYEKFLQHARGGQVEIAERIRRKLESL